MRDESKKQHTRPGLTTCACVLLQADAEAKTTEAARFAAVQEQTDIDAVAAEAEAFQKQVGSEHMRAQSYIGYMKNTCRSNTPRAQQAQD